MKKSGKIGSKANMWAVLQSDSLNEVSGGISYTI